MRTTLLCLAGAATLALAGPSLAASAGAMPDGSQPAAQTPADSTPSAPATPPQASTGAGADTSATTPALTVGENVQDNTGATIGQIAGLKADANGQQMAVIKMGSDQFSVPANRLGATATGGAMINLTQAQITDMLHKSPGN
ncbi:MAG: hypothetical protein ACHP84_14065 [Caulobacterales bacterium]